MLEFMKNGLLPPGDHEISLADLEKVISEAQVMVRPGIFLALATAAGV